MPAQDDQCLEQKKKKSLTNGLYDALLEEGSVYVVGNYFLG